MDKNAIKKYAVWARNELIARVSQKAQQYGITAEGYGEKNADSVNGVLLSAIEKKQRQALIAKIDVEGFEQVIEEVAYTWFNRFTALRFMEVNNYLPSHTRVFTNEANEFKPQILADAISLEIEGLDMDKVFELKNANKDEELYKYLLIVQCNALSSILPGMFQKISDYTELLLPDYLLREGSVIDRLIDEISEVDFNVQDESGQIEIIGWMYQYYISEKHEEVVDPIHGKVVSKDEVPAATQLFTTDWVVRYIVDNSVGRYWIERNPNSQLGESLEYYVNSKCDKKEKLEITPQEITVFDPCIGSGHFAVYAFDVLMKIYLEYGYSEREAATEIVKNNIYGLDIDSRATQLAYFAVMMKARQYDRRFFSRGVQPMIFSFIDSTEVEKSVIDYMITTDSSIESDVKQLTQVMKNAREYGSIMIMPNINYMAIERVIEKMLEENNIFSYSIQSSFIAILNVAKLLSKKYAVVVTNPPYLNKYDAALKDYVTTHYKDYFADLFSVFMYRNFGFCKKDGYSGFMTPNVWMFIKSYEKLRNYILDNKTIVSLVQMAKGAFFKEATVDVAAFILKNAKEDTEGDYIRLEKFKGDMEVQKNAFVDAVNNLNDCNYYFRTHRDVFEKIPGRPIAYWVSTKMLEAFDSGDSFGGETKKGVLTGNNARFTRLWYEVDFSKIGLGLYSHDEMVRSKKKWFPVTSGGTKRKWYGNLDTIVNLENDGAEIKANVQNYRLRDPQYYMLEAVTWTEVSSGLFTCRYVPRGILFGNGGPVSFFRTGLLKYHLGLLNSNTTMSVMEYLAPTVNYGPEQIGKIPLIKENVDEIEKLVDECIAISKDEWDSYEVSWEFTENPLVKISREQGCTTIGDAFEIWKQICDDRFDRLKKIEEQINNIFIIAYGLQDEMIPAVEDKNVTVRLADKKNDVKLFISYFVGCMFGRYSLNEAGLKYAGGDDDCLVNSSSTFRPDKDNIIPITDDEYFTDDDIVNRFCEFMVNVFGKANLEDNLLFIAEAIGGKGNPRDCIRSYFINEFYTDHLKMYQKCPIYWLFDSGKSNGLKCLVYMHRYQADTIARIRTDYVHEQQSRYRTALADLEQRINSASTSERVKLNKQLKAIQDQAEELRKYEEKIHHLADQMISIDLDDGVKANYAKFQDVLAKIK